MEEESDEDVPSIEEAELPLLVAGSEEEPPSVDVVLEEVPPFEEVVTLFEEAEPVMKLMPVQLFRSKAAKTRSVFNVRRFLKSIKLFFLTAHDTFVKGKLL